MFTIEKSTQVPAIGSVNELAVLDFKAGHSSDPLEAATDVTAMGNAYGGAILIGAIARNEGMSRVLLILKQRTREIVAAPGKWTLALTSDDERTLAHAGASVIGSLASKMRLEGVRATFPRLWGVQIEWGAQNRSLSPQSSHGKRK